MTANILVVGDVMLDVWAQGTVRRTSPEAPVPVLSHLQPRMLPGGAANVAKNIVEMGGKVTLAGVVGRDENAKHLIRAMEAEHADCGFDVFVRPGCTTTKTRYLHGEGGHLLRVDVDRDEGTLHEHEIVHVLNIMHRFDVLIISDYCKGCITPALAERLIAHARNVGVPVFVDSKDCWNPCFKGAFCFTPNTAELEGTHPHAFGGPNMDRTAHRLLAAQVADFVVLKRGAQGMLLAQHSSPMGFCIASDAKHVREVSGAGDTVVAALAVAHAIGLPTYAAMRAANAAAAYAVETPLTAAVTLPLNWQDIGEDVLGKPHKACGRVGFANGCFDLLHPGHVDLLKAARADCDTLVVGLNTDASIRRLKGPGRPAQPYDERRRAIEVVAPGVLVADFYGTPAALVAAVRPEVIYKGGDYKDKLVVGSGYADVKLFPYLEGYSTTQQIELRKAR